MNRSSLHVTVVSRSDSEGGADRAAYRLHQAFSQSEQIVSKMVVHYSNTADPTVITPGGKLDRFFFELRPRLGRITDPLHSGNRQGKLSPALFSSGLPSLLNKLDTDIIHLHWPMNEMMSVKDFSRIKKPVVWTMHDMWAFCGAEHYTHNQRYVEGYRKENRPSWEKGLDLNRWTWLRKQKHWNSPISIIAPSRWMMESVKESYLMEKWPVEVIPNTIDTDFWKPESKISARKMLGLPEDQHLILFGAVGGTRDSRKGYDLLEAALEKLNLDTDNVLLIVIGSKGAESKTHKCRYKANYLGHLFDDVSLKLVCNAADLILLPSRQDNLPNLAVEGFACGVPVVAFRTGGIPDIIEHKKNGWLADPYDIVQLAQGIEWILQNPEKNNELSLNARSKALNTFSNKVVVQKHFKFYDEVIKRAAGSRSN